MKPIDALILLSSEYPDEFVRCYAVSRVKYIPDTQLKLYLGQLCQALLHENEHLNPLGELLLEKSLANPYVIGQDVFWILKSQMALRPSCERFGLYIEQLLMLSGSYAHCFYHQNLVTHLMCTLARKYQIAGEADKEKSKEVLRKDLQDLTTVLPKDYTLPHDVRDEFGDINVQSCCVLSSKKKPIMVKYKNPVNENDLLPIIYKYGDDLRQDILTLQIFRIMDQIWLSGGLDLRLTPYIVVATDDQVGLVQCVKNSRTISELETIYSTTKVTGAFEKNYILEFLKDANQNQYAEEQAIDNFIRSCAGYCVATCILGIGDRHNDNIMVKQTGHIFHIDFGHILGHFKKKMGVNRERSPFVLLESMVQVMGGENSVKFEQFSEYCSRAYNMLRKNGWHLMHVLQLMLPAGMVELNKNSIGYLKRMLKLDLTDQEATKYFKKQISRSMRDKFRRFDNFLHNIKHR